MVKIFLGKYSLYFDNVYLKKKRPTRKFFLYDSPQVGLPTGDIYTFMHFFLMLTQQIKTNFRKKSSLV